MKQTLNRQYIRRGFLLLFLIIFIVSAVQIVRIVWNYYAADEEYDRMQEYVQIQKEPAVAGSTETGSAAGESKSAGNKGSAQAAAKQQSSAAVDFKSLRKKNPDCIAWIYVPGTNISYPVMQGEDNEYYLKHTFSGKELTSASIFMDCKNAADFTDSNTFIYGHNMKDGSMFGTLSEYEKKEYYQKHPGFYLYTPSGSYYYQIFSCYRVDLQNQADAFTLAFSSKEEYTQYQQKVAGYSLYDTNVVPQEDQRMITLSTCHKTGYEYRFLVHAVQVAHH